MPTPSATPMLVDRQDQLDRLCRNFADARTLAVDTEFMRTNTYAPRLGLLQVRAEDQTALVDPLADIDLQPLWQLLFGAEHICILHSAKQDMEAVWFREGQLPSTLVDTQVCAGLLGYPAQTGYANLAAELLQVSMGKSETRTDWTRRPLTPAQLEYAAEDVLHLQAMHNLLREQLEKSGRYSWAIEDSAALCDEALYRPDPQSAWQRIKRIPFLAPAEQARAKALAEWREQRAVAANRPRQWILSDKALLELAARNPADNPALRKMRELPPAVMRRQATELLELLTAANTAYAADPAAHTRQVPERDNTLLKKLLKIVQETAAALGIAPEILASKRDVEKLLQQSQDCRCLSGWRRAVIGEPLLSALPPSAQPAHPE